jgi:hypothetical protein
MKVRLKAALQELHSATAKVHAWITIRDSVAFVPLVSMEMDEHAYLKVS